VTVARLGLVGLGRWGRRYADTIARLPGVRLATVATSRAPDPPLPPDTRVVRSWPELLAVGGPEGGPAHGCGLDGVVLAVPPQHHRAIALACLARGLPVLVEKPMATTIDDATAIAEAARRSGVPVLVDHTQLFTPAFERLQQLAGPGPLRIRGEGGGHGPFGRAVDPLWDWGPHDVALALTLAGATPTAVQAHRHAVTADGGVLTDLVLRFERGDVAWLTVGNAMADKRRYLRVDDGQQVLVVDGLSPHPLTRDTGTGPAVVDVAASRPLDRVVEQFAALAVAGVGHHPSVDLGVDVVRVLAATGVAATP
jgi:predicted dehydrogenase